MTVRVPRRPELPRTTTWAGWDRIRLETSTLWDFAYQSPATVRFGDNRYNGVTPAEVCRNVIERFSESGDLVVDVMAGSGTTLDVARSLGRRSIGFDLTPVREDVHRADARHIPLPDDSVDLYVLDSPYGDNVRYSEDPADLGNLPADDPRFARALEEVAREVHRTLRPGGIAAWIISDEFKGGTFTPVGFQLFGILRRHFEPIDIVCLVRRNDRSMGPMWLHRARKNGHLLRGFKYLFLMRKRIVRQPSEVA